jgi:hypothetical protein
MKVLPSGLPSKVDDREELARFLTQSGHFNSLVVRPAAFLPNPRDRETSVSRHGQEPADSLWALGRLAAEGRKLYGAGIFTAQAVRAVQLCVAADEPPPRHAVICNWPWVDDDPELQKAKQKELALSLSRAAGRPLLLKQ